MGVPGIIASQATFPNRNVRVGVVTLTWDGGPAHPHLDLWVKINRGPDIFVVRQPSGTRVVPVERGGYYVYILKENGRIIAATEFIAH